MTDQDAKSSNILDILTFGYKVCSKSLLDTRPEAPLNRSIKAIVFSILCDHWKLLWLGILIKYQ